LIGKNPMDIDHSKMFGLNIKKRIYFRFGEERENHISFSHLSVIDKEYIRKEGNYSRRGNLNEIIDLGWVDEEG